jgi:hypothetical protein
MKHGHIKYSKGEQERLKIAIWLGIHEKNNQMRKKMISSKQHLKRTIFSPKKVVAQKNFEQGT